MAGRPRQDAAGAADSAAAAGPEAADAACVVVRATLPLGGRLESDAFASCAMRERPGRRDEEEDGRSSMRVRPLIIGSRCEAGTSIVGAVPGRDGPPPVPWTIWRGGTTSLDADAGRHLVSIL